MNEWLATTPFDLYELTLFRLVAEEGSFTRAAERAGRTQSAITRQIRGLEERLGVELFERTTRHVCLTRAGRLLLEKSGSILRSTGELFTELQAAFHGVPAVIQIGFARSIGLACLPGYFFAFQRDHPEIQVQVSQRTSLQILQALEAGELDVGLVCPPPRLPRTLEATHRFADEFTVIVPPRCALPSGLTGATVEQLKKQLSSQRWLMIEREGFTGRRLNLWLKRQGWRIEPAMEADSFDVIVNLVSLGLGASLVPRRTLAMYAGRRAVRRIATEPRFSRELAVVVRRNRRRPEILRAFTESVLF